MSPLTRQHVIHVPVHAALSWCIHVALLASAWHVRVLAEKDANISYGVPWGRCTAPIPSVVAESTGASIDGVLALCLRSPNPTTTFENAETFFIGNSSNPNVKGFGTLCAKITQQYIFSVAPPAAADETYAFLPADFPVATFGNQAWAISLWDVNNADENTTVDLTVSNFGETDIAFTGIDYGAYGLDDGTYFPVGNVTTLNLNLKQVAENITYEGLPILNEYLYGDDNNLPAETPTALIFVNPLDGPKDPQDAVGQVTYAIVRDRKFTVATEDRFTFFLYETTKSLTLTSSGTGTKRRLLVASAKNTAPPTACSKGCCKAASPLPKGCAAGGKTWPACSKGCACACK